jgi:hypothetical protein
MNLLNYTKKIYEKIKYYDNNLKNKNFNKDKTNPFSVKEPENITIIWTE